MAMFSESGLEASGFKEKMRLCPKCGRSLTYIDGKGYCCSRDHGCWWPSEKEEKVIREEPSAIYAGGAIKKKGGSRSGRKRKKPLRRDQWVKKYIEV